MASNCTDGESVKARITQLMVTLGRSLAADEIYLKFQSTFHNEISVSSVGCSTLEELLRSMDNVCLDLLLSEPFGGRSYFKLKESAVSFERPPTPTECDAASISPAQRLRQLTAVGGTGISMQDEGQPTSGVDDLLGDCQTLISHHPSGICLLDLPQKFEEVFGRPIPMDGVQMQELWRKAELLPSIECRLSETYGEPMFVPRLDGGGDRAAASDSINSSATFDKLRPTLVQPLTVVQPSELSTWPINDKRRLIQIIVTQIESPALFFAIQKENYDMLMALQAKMDKCYQSEDGEKLRMTWSDAEKGSDCALKFAGGENQFHRARIVNISKTERTAEVLYVDWGTRETVPLSELFHLGSEFVDAFPPLCLRFRVADMPTPTGDIECPPTLKEDSAIFRELAKLNESLFTAQLLDVKPSEDCRTYLAKIYYKCNNKAKLLTDYYKERGLQRPTEPSNELLPRSSFTVDQEAAQQTTSDSHGREPEATAYVAALRSALQSKALNLTDIQKMIENLYESLSEKKQVLVTKSAVSDPSVEGRQNQLTAIKEATAVNDKIQQFEKLVLEFGGVVSSPSSSSTASGVTPSRSPASDLSYRPLRYPLSPNAVVYRHSLLQQTVVRHSSPFARPSVPPYVGTMPMFFNSTLREQMRPHNGR